MKKFLVLAVLAVILCSSTLAYADGNVCTWAESKRYSVSAPGKLTRGLINLCLGWTNIFVQPFKEDDVMSGIGKGLSDFAVRTFQGAGEILLFWLPPVPNEPLKECVFYDWGAMQKPS